MKPDPRLALGRSAILLAECGRGYVERTDRRGKLIQVPVRYKCAVRKLSNHYAPNGNREIERRQRRAYEALIFQH
jgi:hypothetical protein